MMKKFIFNRLPISGRFRSSVKKINKILKFVFKNNKKLLSNNIFNIFSKKLKIKKSKNKYFFKKNQF